MAFRDPLLFAYFCMLFHAIQHQAPTDVALSGWDLFHGHMFIHVASEGDAIVADLGILFHSKEYPEEYGNNTGRYPIGCPEAGGNLKDPRIGTKYSVLDKDFHVRNYLWLLSTNSIVLFDLLDSACPASIIGNQQFLTVKTDFFSKFAVADINYHMGVNSKTKNFHPEAEEMLKHKSERLKDLHAQTEALVVVPSTENPPRKHVKISVTETMSLIKKWLLWFHDKIEKYETTFAFASQDIFVCPFDLNRDPCHKIAEHLHEISSLVGKLDEKQIMELQSKFATKFQNHDYLLAEPFIKCISDKQFVKRKEDMLRLENKELEKLISKGITREDALESLTMSTIHTPSAYRAESLLAIAHAKYRSKGDIEKYGSFEMTLNEANRYFTVCNDVDIALAVIKLIEERGESLSIEEASNQVIAQREAEMEDFFRQEAEKLRLEDERAKSGEKRDES